MSIVRSKPMGMIEDHHRHTQSPLARRILDNWDAVAPQVVKVIPADYKRVLQARRAARPRAQLKAVGNDG